MFYVRTNCNKRQPDKNRLTKSKNSASSLRAEAVYALQLQR